jgi:hypothetical protein
VVNINGISAQNAGETGYMQITMMAEYNKRLDAIRREEGKKEEAAEREYLAMCRTSFEVLSAIFQWDGENHALFFGPSVYMSRTPFTAIGFEFGIGYSNDGKSNDLFWRASPAIGLYFPIGKHISVFTDALLEIGYFGNWHGLLRDIGNILSIDMTPSFDVGIIILRDNYYFEPAVCLKYRGVWYKDSYAHSIGLSFVLKM